MPTIHRRRSLFIALTALIVLISGWLAAYGFTLWRLRDAALESGLNEATTHTRNFEKHLTQTLEMIELVALGLAPGQNGASIDERFTAQMNDALRKAPYLRSLSLTDAQGMVLFSSSPANVGTELTMRGFFPDLSANSSMIHIGALWQGRDLVDGTAKTPGLAVTSKHPSFIPVLRRIGGNSTPYWVVAALNPEYFTLHFSQLLAATDGHVQILRHDGLLLLSSRTGEQPGQSNAAGDVHEWLIHHDAGQLAQTLPDGAKVLTAYRGSSRFPALVAVHMDQDAILERWRSEARRLALIVFPILFALTAAAVLVWRRQQRLEQKEHELSEQRRLAASVFEATNNSVFLTTPDGDILAANPAFERISGYSTSEVIGRNPRLLASGLHDPAFYQKMWQSVLASGHWDGEIINKNKDGRLYTGLLNINAVHDDSGRLKHYVGVIADITERKLHEAELLAAKEKAEAASLAKTTFLATMSHELRTPMNGVLGMTEILLRSPLDEKQQRQLNIVRKSATSLLTILDQILDYSKIESHSLVLEHVPFDPATLILDLAALFTPAADAKSLKIRTTLAPDLPARLTGDPVRLRQALTSLLSNAVKFTREGEILISARHQLPDMLRISVSDTGIGIAPEKQQQIFAAFTQADGSASREFGGTGLGLAISHRLAEAMGGSLQVDSEPGRGSHFTLNIRASQA